MRRRCVVLLAVVVVFSPVVVSVLLADTGRASAVVGAPWSPPTPQAWLGTDSLGRDVLVRLVLGGGPLILTAVLGAMATTGLGAVLGLAGGWGVGRLRHVLLAGSDVLLALPGLLVALSVAVALPGVAAVVVSSVVVGAPLTAKVVSDGTRRVLATGYVEAAVARGETAAAVLLREVLPSMRGLLAADIALRFIVAMQIAAALSALGLGAQPPAPDWALALRQELPGSPLNAWAVLAPAAALAVVACAAAGLARSAPSIASERP